MIYSYPPIYKYCILFLIIYMFIKHQKIMLPNILLLNTVFILLFIIFIDYILIDNHPYPFVTENIDDDLFVEEFQDENENNEDQIEDIPVFNKNLYNEY